jgi:hypothetical protein
VASSLDNILDDLFHGCALSAFVEQAKSQMSWPDEGPTRVRVYRFYEDALKVKNSHKP